MLGEIGKGFAIAMGVLDAARIGIAPQAVGIARAACEATLQGARERKAFGHPLGTFQMTPAKIADKKCKLDAAMLLTLRAAWARMEAERNGGGFNTEAAVAKRVASEAAMWITHPARITGIYEGTSEIQRMVIARAQTGLR